MFDTRTPASRHTVAFIGTYPPMECGIATFTMDAVNATDLAGWRSSVIAVDTADGRSRYHDSIVIDVINRDLRSDYRRTARRIQALGISLVSIEHEYGIFGGDDGDYILDLIEAVDVPVVVTLHTVMPEPTESQLRIVKAMEKHAAAFIVMAQTAVVILRDIYGVDEKKVHFIPHGAPMVPFHVDKSAKAAFGLQGKRVISTFGLISPNKGIEDAIAAMPAVVEQEPNAVYLVLGQTHPVIKRREGEWYREQLVQQVRDLGIEENVRFVDKYLSLQELLDYLLATDVYVTPYYANPHQITSGTLAYALTAGKVIVSTPYLYAKELLAGGRGFLYPFRDVPVLSESISQLLTDHELFDETRKRAYAYGQTMTWPTVGLRYSRLFTNLLNERWSHEAARDTLSMLSIYERETAESRSAPVYF